MIILYLLIPLLLALPLLPASEALAQQAVRSIDHDTLRTGDLFSYHLRLDDVEDFDEVIYPDSSGFGEEFIIRNKRVEPVPGGDSIIYSLQFFGVDTDRVPELYAGLREGDDTLFVVIPAVSFVYESRVDDEASELRPIKPIFPFFRSRWLLIFSLLALAVIAALLVYYFRERLFGRKSAPASVTKAAPAEPFQNPLDRLRNEIDRVGDTYPNPSAHPKSYYTELGDAFRTYFEETHDFPAMESTTREVIRTLEKKSSDEKVVQLISDILKEADLVKFARFRPNESQCNDVIRKAEHLAGRIAIIDRQRIEALRKEHELKQQRQHEVETRYDLG
ncbi:hypothetical protein QA596_06950 [Balneolales bacterium ANBcel1]|nr:hypothetical protein [Balneolales bacterium ANBcel1]